MQRNFRVEGGGAELTGKFGFLDIHNAYELLGCDLNILKKSLSMRFISNEHAPPKNPTSFRLFFENIEFFELRPFPGDISGDEINEIGFKRPDDFNYEYWQDDSSEITDEHLVVWFWEKIMRINAESATVDELIFPS